ncbi:penicillin-binding protein 1A [Candidatus Foliamicus sp.]
MRLSIESSRLVNAFMQICVFVAAGVSMCLVFLAMVISGAYFHLAPGLPSVERIREVPLQIPMQAITRDGRLIGEVGEKLRTPVALEDVPELLRNAFLAAEDDRFFEHPGYDYQGLARAAFNLLLTRSASQGGSTITQQLAREYYVDRERTFVRKARELFVAMRLERELSKQEILELYLNKIFLGNRAYGVAAAAQVYFGKSLQELSIAESATLAGLPKAPSAINPVRNPARATNRRAYVLRRLKELGFINEAQRQIALNTPMESTLHGPRREVSAPWVLEMVREEMLRRYGLDAYTGGFRVSTTIDSRMQAAAERALRRGLRDYDRRHGYRGVLQSGALNDWRAEGLRSDAELLARLQLLQSELGVADTRLALVTGFGEAKAVEVLVEGLGRKLLSWEHVQWRPYISVNARGRLPNSPGEMLAMGDLIRVREVEDGVLQLTQEPDVQGALVAIDPHDGAVVALVGGYDFARSRFNRATHALRQPGSVFKPFIYSAALEHGLTAATIVNDAPVVIQDPATETVWRPKNNSGRINGPTRLREALVRSMNLVSVRVLLRLGLPATIEHIRAFGLPESSLPESYSLALGSGGAAPLDIARGYAPLANGGYRVDPWLIERVEQDEVRFRAEPLAACRECELPGEVEASASVSVSTAEWLNGTKPRMPAQLEHTFARIDRLAQLYPDVDDDDASAAFDSVAQMQAVTYGRKPDASQNAALFANVKRAPRAVNAENAYIVYDMMRAVVSRGTGRRATALGRSDLAGKTGTTNDNRDAWFSGFNGNLLATAWVGFDQERSLGSNEEGGRTALPLWIYFMEEALRGAPEAPLPRPAGIVSARISPTTGLLARAGEADAIFELFREQVLPAAPDSAPASAAESEEELF